MKKIKYITSLIVAAMIFSCSTENDLIDLDTLAAPTNISALTTVTQDIIWIHWLLQLIFQH